VPISNIRILLIEDNPGDARLIQEMLSDVVGVHFDTSFAKTLAEGLAHIEKGLFDVVLLDLGLPDSQGESTLEKVYAKNPALAIVVLTGLSDESVGMKAVHKGAQDYLVKGYVDSNLLGRTIRYSVERKAAEKELRETKDYLENLFNHANAPIVVWDPEFKITRFNQAFEYLTGYRSEEVLGKKLEVLFPKESIDRSAKAIERVLSGERWESVEIPILRKDGKVRIALWNSANIYEAGKMVATIAQGQDITVRKEAEDRIKASLKEKDILLREIHHRVKNNLQIICSLINLQSGYVKDKETVGIFRDCQNRVKTMALVHEELYRSDDFSRIEFGEYIRRFADHLIISYGSDYSRIKINVETKGVFLDISSAISCALIMNELVSNSLKHAFKDKAGEIFIGLHMEEDQCGEGEKKVVFTVSDNGVGLPPDLDFRNTTSLGFQLITALTEQLSGTIERDDSLKKQGKGVGFKITFYPLKGAKTYQQIPDQA
jgi:PAS domain S-box-containing protein